MKPGKKSKKQEKLNSYWSNVNENKTSSSNAILKNMTKSELLIYLKGELIKVEIQIKDLNLKKNKILELILECEDSNECKERNENDKKEISYSKLDDFISGNADSDLEQGWLKNSVLDLAENIFDKVDFDMFKMNFSQPEPFENSGQNSDKQDSQFFIHSLNYNINELMPKENKSNHEILGYTKTILNRLDKIEEMNKEELGDLATSFGLKSKNTEKALKKHLVIIREYLIENKLPEEYLKDYQENIKVMLELNNDR